MARVSECGFAFVRSIHLFEVEAGYRFDDIKEGTVLVSIHGSVGVYSFFACDRISAET